MDEALERVWARWCARRVLHLWDAPEVVREWLDTGDEAAREEAREAVRAATARLEAAERVALEDMWAIGAAASSAWAAALAMNASSWEDADLAADEALGAVAALATDGATAAWDAEASRAREAGWGEAEVEDAAGAAAWAAADAAVDTEFSAQQRAHALIEVLSTLLPAQGLSALRLDEALEDRWITREVWRALGLPGLVVVCDWASALG